jgi:hypothetical protein
MIVYNRTMKNRWIFQKNISSSQIIIEYLKKLREDINIDYEKIKSDLKNKNVYKGRSEKGSISTFGVRLSQMSFFMFGYKKDNKFIPSPMTINLTNELDNKLEVSKNILVNLFSLQFPHPYSSTPDNFEINAGRLIIKLFTEERIKRRIYMDEFVWLIPFIEKIDSESYEGLIKQILIFRNLSYSQKLDSFKSIPDYERIFANLLHEFNYYFVQIFSQFGVIKTVIDNEHNGGRNFTFKHSENTYRSDSISKGIKQTGFLILNKELIELAESLLSNFSVFEKPLTVKDENMTLTDLKTQLFELNPIKYLALIFNKNNKERQILDIVTYMLEMSIKPNTDGKEFELSVLNLVKLFGDILKVEHISGAGDTDISCIGAFEDNNTKFNIETKARSSINGLNVSRINRHIQKNGSRYCLVIAPRFPYAVTQDVKTQNIVLLSADSLANYCSKEVLKNRSNRINFENLHTLIKNNLGQDISGFVTELYSSNIK